MPRRTYFKALPIACTILLTAAGLGCSSPPRDGWAQTAPTIPQSHVGDRAQVMPDAWAETGSDPVSTNAAVLQ